MKINDELKLNLQLFAEDTSTDEDTQNNDEDTQEQEDNKDFDINKILENEEFQKFLQSHTDKRVTDAVKKRDTEWKKKLDEEKKKAEMSQEEILAEKEKELQNRELKLSKIDFFKENNYDLDLIDFVPGADIDEVKENSEKLMKSIEKVVEKRVSERLSDSSYTPPNDKKDKLTIESIKNMSPEEINQHWETVQEVLKNQK